MTIDWRKAWHPLVVGPVSLLVGAVSGYVFCSQRNKYIIQSVEEHARVLEEQVLILREDVVDPPKTTKALSGDFVEAGASFVEKTIDRIIIDEVVEVEEVTVVSAFPDVDETWNYEEELKQRTPDAPYIIHRDEFYAEESGFDHSTLTYYEGDDVLCDENDTPIYNPHQVASPLMFGKGSGDANVVHIRNEKLEAEYEVVRDRGHFAVEVLGAQFEENMSREKPIIHKFKQD